MVRRGTGRPPKGWLGPALTETFNTPDILAELGLSYLLDWCNDDQPYPVNVSQGRMIMVPYSIAPRGLTRLHHQGPGVGAAPLDKARGDGGADGDENQAAQEFTAPAGPDSDPGPQFQADE